MPFRIHPILPIIPMKLTLDEFPATTYEEWKAAAEESLKGAPFDKKLITSKP